MVSGVVHLGAQLDLDPSLLLWPVHFPLLQIDVLQLLVPLVGESDIVAIVGLLPCEMALPARGYRRAGSGQMRLCRKL